MEVLKLKEAEITSEGITIIKDRFEIFIDKANIKKIEYCKPSFWNFITASVGNVFPGRLEIYLKNKVGRTKLYLVKIEYNDISKLPSEILDLFVIRPI
jgi:hypothetical protein